MGLLGNKDLAGAILGRAQEGKTREEIQAELDQEVVNNMLTVGFENDRDNKFDQRFTLSQGEDVLYESQAIGPGERIDAVRVDGVGEGEAVVEIQAVDPDSGDDHGSPTAVQVNVVKDPGEASTDEKAGA